MSEVGRPRFRNVYLTPGTYLLRVHEKFAGTAFAGPVTMHLWLTPQAREVGNACLKPIVVPLDASGTAVLTGTTVGMYPAAEDKCEPTNPEQPSMIYQLDLPVRSYVSVRAIPKEPSFNVELEWLESCFHFPWDYDCRPSPNPGAPEDLILAPAEAGRYTTTPHAGT